ncbi:MAG: DUF305 domain-containing protein [Bacillota bacterium]
MKKLAVISLAIMLVVGLVGTSTLAQRGHMGRRNFQDSSQTGDDFSGFGFGGMMGFGGAMHTSVESEYDYLVKMIPHHEEAVRTARTLRENTESEEMRDFADDIISTQSEEIEEMNSYLDNWYPDRESDYDYEPMMGDYTDLNGSQMDQAFLEDMILHHMEAVMMSQQLLAQGLVEHQEVEELAVSISNSQREEIFMMRNWLAGSYTDSDFIGRGGVMGNMMGRGFIGSDFDRFSDLSEEELTELREVQREQMRVNAKIEVLREEYRQLIREDASDEELRSIENEIFELQEERTEAQAGTGFFQGRGSFCW